MATTRLLLALTVLMSAALMAASMREPPQELRIGVLHRPENCDYKVGKGDKISVHCRRPPPGRAVRSALAGQAGAQALMQADKSATRPSAAAPDSLSFFDDPQTEVDSTLKRNKPVEFTIGIRQIIAGGRARARPGPSAGEPHW